MYCVVLCDLLDDSADKAYFDSDGNFLHQSTRNRVGPRFGKEHVLGVLLNLDESSPQKNTMSLFRDGSRASEPQKLPEGLIGKTLYPSFTYKHSRRTEKGWHCSHNSGQVPFS